MKSRINIEHWLLSRPIAHRGLHQPQEIPENSMLAFEKAIKANHPIELDVQLTKDNKVIVFHDNNLLRLTGVNAAISEKEYKEIDGLTLLSASQKIPLLSEVLRSVNGTVPLLIEIKTQNRVGDIEPPVYDMLNKYKGDYAIQSFDPRVVNWFRINAPEVLRGYISGPLKDEKLNPIKRWFLSNLIAVPFIKPDFIAYDISGIDKLCLWVFKHTSKKPLLAWVIRDSNAQDSKRFDNIIFEDQP